MYDSEGMTDKQKANILSHLERVDGKPGGIYLLVFLRDTSISQTWTGLVQQDLCHLYRNGWLQACPGLVE